MKERENLHFATDERSVNSWWLKPRLWLVDLNYNFECDWLIDFFGLLNCPITKLPNNKLSK